MKCLAVNTANSVLSLALLDGGRTVYFFETRETRDQGNLLISHAQKGLAAAGCGFQDIDVLAVATGPGSFTGIRIGIAALRGIALASGKPLLGISSFDLFAEYQPGIRHIVALESWREELYLRLDGQPPVNVPPADFARDLGEDEGGGFLISGDAREKLAAVLPGAAVSAKDPDARDLAALAVRRFQENGAPKESPVPFYLREADVTLSTKNRTTQGI